MTALDSTTKALRLLLLLAACMASPAAPVGASEPWIVERDTADPSYAAVAPSRTNLNIDTVVLACEQGLHKRVLQLQLYLTDDGTLRRTDVAELYGEPRAEAAIDGQLFAVPILFADDHVVLADTRSGPFPALSDGFLDSLQRGATLTLRFDRGAGSSPESGFDAEAVVDLHAPGGAAAIAAVRRCASSDAAAGDVAMTSPGSR